MLLPELFQHYTLVAIRKCE